MNKATIIQTYCALLATLQLQPHELVLSAGGACVMLGLRETTRDLDVEVDPELFALLKKRKPERAAWFGSTEVLAWSETIDLHVARQGSTQMIEGVCCYSTQRLLRQKRLLRRSKDHADIAALMPLLY